MTTFNELIREAQSLAATAIALLEVAATKNEKEAAKIERIAEEAYMDGMRTWRLAHLMFYEQVSLEEMNANLDNHIWKSAPYVQNGTTWERI